MKKKMFDKIKLGGIEVKNRFVRGAVAEVVDNSEGMVDDKLIKLYDDMSKGNIGLIITGFTEVLKEAATASIIRINDDKQIYNLKKLSDVVHKNGSKVVLQLVHYGVQALGEINYAPLVPSDTGEYDIEVKEATQEDINRIVKAFGEGALRAKKAGFDGVEIHGAHGYILSRFLTPKFNTRKDNYGGSLENRMRIILEVYKEIREKCGEDYPIFLKINSSDFLDEGGFTFEDCLEASKIFDKVGFNAIELSGGLGSSKYTPSRTFIRKKEEEAYHLEYSKEVAKVTKFDVISVGGFRSLDVMEDALNTTDIDAISLARPFIKEPMMLNTWKENDYKSTCISCNKCFNPNGIECIFNKKK